MVIINNAAAFLFLTFYLFILRAKRVPYEVKSNKYRKMCITRLGVRIETLCETLTKEQVILPPPSPPPHCCLNSFSVC